MDIRFRVFTMMSLVMRTATMRYKVYWYTQNCGRVVIANDVFRVYHLR